MAINGKLDRRFYDRSDVLTIARELVGKVLVSHLEGKTTSGRIVETEAYAGITDRASHAWNNRRTARTEIMFGSPGHAYVYLCYGIHHLFNVVTNKKEIPHAILIRALEPLEGVKHMLLRTGSPENALLCNGPGKLSKALGIKTTHTGLPLLGDELYIKDDGYEVKAADIVATPRIGVDYAGADAQLPYRFLLKGNRFVSAG